MGSTYRTQDTDNQIASLFRQALGQLSGLGPEFSTAQQKLRALQDRLINERFHLAVLGQFKRGKSTLINALLGEEILPTAVVSLTAVPTFITWDTKPHVRVLRENGLSDEKLETQDAKALSTFLSQFVTEEGNPKNRKRVRQVELFYPSPLLRPGVILIDTPGIGSTFQHNTATTFNFLPQCDAALFLVSADPPITEVEIEFLRAVRSQVAHLFFVLNKVDYLDREEIATLSDFLKTVLNEQANLEDTLIFCLSARQALKAKKTNDEKLWSQSGAEEIWNYLADFLAQHKRATLRVALARKAADVLSDTLMHLELRLRGLQMPLADLDQRVKIFEQKIQEAERQRVLVQDLLAGDKSRMLQLLEERAERLRQEANDHLQKVVEKYLDKTKGRFEENQVGEVIANAIPDFFAPKLEELGKVFEARVTEVLRSYQQQADQLIETVRKAAAELFDVPYRAPSSSEAFAMERQPYWVTHKWDTGFGELSRGLTSRLLPAQVRQTKAIRRLTQQINDLVMHNVENLRWAILQNLDRAFRGFGSSLDQRLQETVSATLGAMQSAQSKRREQTQNLAPRVAQLQTVINNLREIRAQLETLIQ